MSPTRSHRGWLSETTDDDAPGLVPGAFYVTSWWQSGYTVLRLLRVRTGVHQPDKGEGEPYVVPVLVMRQVWPTARRYVTLRDPRELLRVIEDPPPDGFTPPF